MSGKLAAYDFVVILIFQKIDTVNLNDPEIIMKKLYTLIAIIAGLSLPALSQPMTNVPFNADNWKLGKAQAKPEDYRGRQSILLSGGTIYASDINFLDGTIEVDINFPLARFFPEVFFRMQDENNYESFYIRPHQSGNPDATQYTPVFNGLAGWQLYHGEGYTKDIELKPDTWHHIKINVSGKQADVYFDDMDTPFLKITDLKREPQPGKIGVGSGQPVHYANFRYSKTTPDLVAREAAEAQTEPGLITSWQVSNVVLDEQYRDKPDPLSMSGLTWSTQPTEANGTINLARYVRRSEKMNTVLARLNLRAGKATTRELLFGYSDFVWVYVNSRPVYAGRNDFMSRDYRYLGTIGFFDAVYLPLEKGDNEVVFVVGENFGGWGLKAALPDGDGVELVSR